VFRSSRRVSMLFGRCHTSAASVGSGSLAMLPQIGDKKGNQGGHDGR
jgi:hypothetical protein